MKEIFAKTDICTGCQSCRLACSVAHSRTGNLHTALGEAEIPRARLYVEWLEDNLKVPILCRHCEDAPCVNACISGAIARTESGTVVTDADKCIGCWTCVMVCPYGTIGRDKAAGKAYRCDRCPDLDTPACVSACPTGALVYDTVDAYSAGKRKLAAGELVTGEGG